MAPESDHTTYPADGLIIESHEDLVNFLDQLPHPADSLVRCAVDTEADSLHSFKEQLCLIQFSCADKYAIIDPLKITDLRPLTTFLDQAEVWMHGADFDMSLFKRTFDRIPPRVLDTQTAARFCGHKQFGLAAVIENVFGHVLPKSSQRADWGKRPLSPKMVHYAINDVRYILPLVDHLGAQLDQLGRRDWFEKACAQAREAVLQRQPADPEEVWRIAGWGNLQGIGLAVLRALWHWRNGEAERLNRPSFKIFNNEQMLNLALDFQAGKHIDLPPRFPYPPRRRFHQTLDAVKALPPEEYPKRHYRQSEPKNPEFDQRFDHLRDHRQKASEQLKIEGSLIMSRTQMEDLARDPAQDVGLLAWQLEAMQPALATLASISAPAQTAPKRRAAQS
jgi:ribonuclease D